MKTAVSLPDELFQMAEATAALLQISRSELYAKAIAEFLQSRQAAAITERLNDLYSQRTAKLDAGLHRTQLRSIEKEDC